MQIFEKEWKFNGVNYLYMYKYFPPTWHHEVELTIEEKQQNEMISNFKRGIDQQYFIDKLTIGLKQKFSENELKEFTFCIVPASTEVKNERRYLNFCKDICENTGMKNGYEAIKITKDNVASHLGGPGMSPDSISFNYDFNKKKIILFDDISTTGSYITWFSQQLLKRGVVDIFAITIGKSIQKQKD